MATLGFIEYADAPPEVRAVYDDINGDSADRVYPQFLESTGKMSRRHR
jgi:hypothetical protein